MLPKCSFRWEESHKPGGCEVGAACPAVQGGGLMARRRMEPGCNHPALAGWLHPSAVTALKLLDGYYFHYYYFNAPLWTHHPARWKSNTSKTQALYMQLHPLQLKKKTISGVHSTESHPRRSEFGSNISFLPSPPRKLDISSIKSSAEHSN